MPNWNLVFTISFHRCGSPFNLFLNHYLVKVHREIQKENILLNEKFSVKTYFEILYIGDEGKFSANRI